MGEQLVIRGLPESLARDGWWFTDPRSEGDGTDSSDTASFPAHALVPLAILVVLADQMFWDRDLGISVALYAMALSACIIALKPGRATRREWLVGMGVIMAASAPVVELVQPLSLVFCGAGVAIVFVWVSLGTSAHPSQALRLILQATVVHPFDLPRDAARDLRRASAGFDASALARSAVLPLILGAAFVVLIALANPLVEHSINRIVDLRGIRSDTLLRIAFWGGLACLIWPYLTARGQAPAPLGGIPLPSLGLLNGSSVHTSLILFNAIFAVQSVSDLGVLTGGVSLPDGMTYAQYAHRGAYPLLVTALLSGAFAIAAQGLIRENRTLRALLFTWLGQTLFLVLTAALRLSLYVEAYALTHLRVAAFIWMALIFLGLVLIIVQMVQNRPIPWLLAANAGAAAVTLYVCCFVNFAHVITAYNMAHAAPEALDLGYLCALGEQVIPAMMDYGQITDQTACGHGGLPAIRFDPIDSWPEWGFRRWRLQRYLETYHDL